MMVSVDSGPPVLVLRADVPPGNAPCNSADRTADNSPADRANASTNRC
jgi:hypothetical protein